MDTHSRIGAAQQKGQVRRMGDSGTVSVSPLASAFRMRVTRLMTLMRSITFLDLSGERLGSGHDGSSRESDHALFCDT